MDDPKNDAAPSEEATVTDEQLFEEIGEAEDLDKAAEDFAADNDPEADVTSADDFTDDANNDDDDPEPKDTGTTNKDGDDPAKDKPAEEVDIWEGASPEAKAAFELSERKRAREGGTVSGLQKKINDLQKDLENTHDNGPSATEIEADLEKLGEEYPEVAAPLIEELKAIRNTVSQNAERARETEESRQNSRYTSEHDAFIEKHPDGMKVISDNFDVFENWVDDQPRAIRDAFNNNKTDMTDGQSAIKLVDAFKGFLGTDPSDVPDNGDETQKELSSKRQRQLKGARSVQNSSTLSANTGSPGADTDEGMWNDFDRIDRQKEKAGRR